MRTPVRYIHGAALPATGLLAGAFGTARPTGAAALTALTAFALIVTVVAVARPATR
jgi:hypothetical protein